MNKMSRIKMLSVLMLSMILLSACQDFKVSKINDSVVDENALVLGDTIYGKMRFGKNINAQTFQQDAIVTFNHYQYVGYYNNNRQVCVARRKLPEGVWEILQFKDYLFAVNDAHNTISVGICPKDGTIHLAFDMHAHELHYHVSEKGVATHPEKVNWSTSLFGSVSDELDPEKPITSITYPRFIQTPEGGLQSCYRIGGSGGGTRILSDYNPKSGTFENAHPIDSGKGNFKDQLNESNSRNSYPNGYTYGINGKLHATWVWRESSQGANHDLMYAYSEDQGNTWKNNKDEFLTNVPNINTPDITVVDIPRGYGLMNTHGQTVDSKGRIHTVMWHCTDESLKPFGIEPWKERWGVEGARHYNHYWRDNNGDWKHNKLPGVAGNRPKVLADQEDNLYLIFGRTSGLDETITGIYYEKGVLVIMAATADRNWKDWKVIHIEKGPFMNEMLADYYRWKESGILSILVQESSEGHSPSALRILDYNLK